MVNAATEPLRVPRTGSRSWPDWLLGRISAVPAPSWVAYVVAYAALAVLGHAARWLDGLVEPGTFVPLAFLEAFFPVVFLATLQTLNAVAVRSLRTLRPVLTLDEAGISDLAGDLVRTPRGWAAVVGLAAPVFSVLSIVSSPESYGLRPGAGPLMWAWGFTSSAATSAVAFAVVAHAVNQVRMVMRVHRDMVRVDLFRLDPLYAFANLTSWTGISIIGFTVFGMGSLVVVGDVQLSAVDIAIFGGINVVAIGVFIVPLLGLHGRIQAEKERRRLEAGDVLDAAVAEVQARIRAGDYERMDKLNNALAAATSVVATISKVSTWPWRPETLRGFVSAVGLPILIWTITALLGRYF